MKDFYKARITYRGLFAKDHILDISELGQSLQGYARISLSIIHFLATGEVPTPQKLRKAPIRLFTGIPERNGVDFTIAFKEITDLQLILPGLTPILPEIKFSIPVVWSYIINLLSGKENMAERDKERIMELLSQVENNRHKELMEAIKNNNLERLAWKNKTAAKKFSCPNR